MRRKRYRVPTNEYAMRMSARKQFPKPTEVFWDSGVLVRVYVVRSLLFFGKRTTFFELGTEVKRHGSSPEFDLGFFRQKTNKVIACLDDAIRWHDAGEPQRVRWPISRQRWMRANRRLFRWDQPEKPRETWEEGAVRCHEYQIANRHSDPEYHYLIGLKRPWYFTPPTLWSTMRFTVFLRYEHLDDVHQLLHAMSESNVKLREIDRALGLPSSRKDSTNVEFFRAK